jgi:hypothetical protein
MSRMSARHGKAIRLSTTHAPIDSPMDTSEIKRAIRHVLAQGSQTMQEIAEARGESVKELRAFLAGRSGGKDGATDIERQKRDPRPPARFSGKGLHLWLSKAAALERI